MRSIIIEKIFDPIFEHKLAQTQPVNARYDGEKCFSILLIYINNDIEENRDGVLLDLDR